MNPIAEICQRIVEEEFGEKEYPKDFKIGFSTVNGREVKWTSIKCSQCGKQVYFDTVHMRHRCCECSYGF